MSILFIGRLPHSNPALLSALSDVQFSAFSSCAEGEAGLQKLLVSPYLPDLVVVEQDLPDLSGMGFCQQIRQNQALNDMPLLLIGSPELDGLADKVQAGLLDFLADTFHPLELLARIRMAEVFARRLKQLSGRDPLTRLCNEDAFQQVLDREWRRAIREQQYLTLLQLDLDHFERVNLAHGHAAGDLCLKEIGELLSAYPLRPGDLIARSPDGERFWVLLPNTTLEGGRAVAETLRRQIEQLQIDTAEVRIQLTASIGGATLYVHDDAQDPRLLFAAAEDALQVAKDHGRNRVVLTDLTEQLNEDEI